MDEERTYRLICVPHKEGFSVVSLSDILCIESLDTICKIHRTKPGVLDTTNTRINELASRLPQHQFCRIHKGYIVSLEHIVFFNREKSRIRISSGRWLPVGRAYQAMLVQKFDFLR